MEEGMDIFKPLIIHANVQLPILFGQNYNGDNHFINPTKMMNPTSNKQSKSSCTLFM
jgi:hypothetical protein